MGTGKMRDLAAAALIAPRIIGYNAYKAFGWPKLKPMFITLSVTNACDSRCRTCGIWRLKRSREEMTLGEYVKFFGTLGKVFWITIEGGEPFMREDLADIIIEACQKSRPAWMTIATNGSMPKRAVSVVKRVLSKCGRTRLVVNVSIDGVGGQHDYIRGVEGSFKRAIETVHALKRLRQPNLTVGINTVVSKYNVRSLANVANYITEELAPDSYVAEVAERRAKLRAGALPITPRSRELKKHLSAMKKHCRESRMDGLAKVAREAYYDSIITGIRQPNFEGIASAYLMPDGDVWLSCSKRLVAGNIRDACYDFSKIWFGRKASAARNRMNKGYSTTAANAFYSNYVCNLYNLPRMAVGMRVCGVRRRI